MATTRHRPSVEDLVRAYATLLPMLPIINAAAQAERRAPGYGAKATMFDLLTEVVDGDTATA